MKFECFDLTFSAYGTSAPKTYLTCQKCVKTHLQHRRIAKISRG